MKTMDEIRFVTATKEYEKDFWDAMRFKPNAELNMRDAKDSDTGTFYTPLAEDVVLRKVIEQYGVIRSLATIITCYGGSSVIWAADSDDSAEFVPEGETIPGFDAGEDFTRFSVGAHKLAGLVKVVDEFIYDAAFDIRKYLNNRMGKAFARAEDRSFVSGSGDHEPVGLLHDTEGAETGVTTDALTYDDCIELFFSVKPEYRDRAVWLMNDRTALVLRKLKDDGGNYLWNSSDNTILGKPVYICNELPDISAGAKPILFGDLNYYWIVDRAPVSMRALNEKYALSGKVGYLGFELLDAHLVRREAVKAIAVSAEGA